MAGSRTIFQRRCDANEIRTWLAGLISCMSVALMISTAAAQELDPRVRKITDGIYVYVGMNG